jgi:hypothetical protein
MKRLYQWFRGWASFFRSGTPGQGSTRTVRTEVTVREGMTLLVGGVAAGFEICPLCGQKLAPAEAEQARRRLLDGSTSRDDLPADGISP